MCGTQSNKKIPVPIIMLCYLLDILENGNMIDLIGEIPALCKILLSNIYLDLVPAIQSNTALINSGVLSK